MIRAAWAYSLTIVGAWFLGLGMRRMTPGARARTAVNMSRGMLALVGYAPKATPVPDPDAVDCEPVLPWMIQLPSGTLVEVPGPRHS